MNGTEARLYVSWKHSDLDYYMQKDYIDFRKHVKNIIDWGKDKRLKDIRESLDNLLEESRKRASGAAKHKPRHDTKQTQSEQEDPHWQWSATAGQYYHVNPDRTIEWGTTNTTASLPGKRLLNASIRSLGHRP
ncbi:hypothetical protein B0T16DRAFT_498960 [Cercophora newfieldiana]|uniref:Uncharacterized protein n=1 Tax=Cercophora newfieldiana TaxID=92897 RepID=A0AA40CXM0_9PEZI|nr:hypothetical protein B0T16DRAFT_498960 [Cercophora newfieldiana]